jgi:hypothetical protein
LLKRLTLPAVEPKAKSAVVQAVGGYAQLFIVASFEKICEDLMVQALTAAPKWSREVGYREFRQMNVKKCKNATSIKAPGSRFYQFPYLYKFPVILSEVGR